MSELINLFLIGLVLLAGLCFSLAVAEPTQKSEHKVDWFHPKFGRTGE